jgi:hypothetical protein
VKGRATIGLAIGCAALACARPLPPPGGEEDRAAPAIIGTDPEPLATVPEFTGPVVFRFDERISERNVENSALVSPSDGEVSVDRGRSELRISIEGGFQPGRVYRVILLPGIRDLFNNERRAPAELVFSTGPEIAETALAGMVTDRITGRAAENVIVQAVQLVDSAVYSTTADSAAFFAFQHLPVGAYSITAFVDQNRNRRLDTSESVSRPQQVRFASDRDTVPVMLAVLPRDTTAPRITRAEAQDSLQIRLSTDDYLEPDASLEFVQATLFQLPDTTPVPGALRLMHPDSFAAYRRSIGDTLPPARVGGIARAPAAGQRGQVIDTTVALPFRELVVVPAAPLPPRTGFLIRVDGLTNVSGITGGGGEADFTTPAPTQRDTTGAAVRDTTGAAVRDTTGAVVGTIVDALRRRTAPRWR